MKGSIVGLLIGIIMTGAIGMAMYRSTDIDSNFDFILKYNVEGRSVINTYDDTYTKEGSPIIKMKLSKDEMETILSEMQKIDIFNYPESFPEYVYCSLPVKYNLEITYKGSKKNIAWTINNIPPFSINVETGEVSFDDKYKDNEVLLLNGIVRKIIDIIEAKPEYKELPEDKARYAGDFSLVNSVLLS
ncbi:hypothetical protein EHE19_009320 [Ruminiclostridium herbifermentans]|uniref:Uncharacterized protein n=1 Tax=Ruminiclostridium herbifermentans TaxID=2488810 RepID=A0A4U7JIZ4_9FIRM|nr:hypothetical protein [Ruminiclostridium herbifermentans]QNU68573.1 hypothetical protein EHE19_009320 [Ruminiclostridium herbifermentans]